MNDTRCEDRKPLTMGDLLRAIEIASPSVRGQLEVGRWELIRGCGEVVLPAIERLIAQAHAEHQE